MVNKFRLSPMNWTARGERSKSSCRCAAALCHLTLRLAETASRPTWLLLNNLARTQAAASRGDGHGYVDCVGRQCQLIRVKLICGRLKVGGRRGQVGGWWQAMWSHKTLRAPLYFACCMKFVCICNACMSEGGGRGNVKTPCRQAAVPVSLLYN